MTEVAEKIDLKLAIEEIYRELCPKCKENLLALAARSLAVDSITKQLKEQWDSQKTA